jgi:Sulfotransferase family
MIIQIDGWFAGGKSVLWSLLDGHKDIFVNPVHDYSYAMLLDKTNEDEWIEKKHTTFLRKTLAASEYYKFEKLFLEEQLEIVYSANLSEKVPYKTNFYNFDKKFYENLQNMKAWSIEKIVHELYKSHYEEHTKQSEVYPKYYATMSNAWKYKHYHNIPKIFPNMKSIIVKRGLKNIIATRTNRQERTTDLNSYQAFSTPFDILIERKEVDWILNFFHTNEVLQEQFPKQFMVVAFEDLVHNTQESMKKIATFLEIEYSDILTLPSRDGKILEYEGISFIGQENDDYQQLLSKEEIETLDKMEAEFHKEKTL